MRSRTHSARSQHCRKRVSKARAVNVNFRTDEVLFFLNTLPPQAGWHSQIGTVPSDDAHGEDIRLLFMAAWMRMNQREEDIAVIDLSPSQLWLLDSVLVSVCDFYKGRTAMNTPYLIIGQKVWDALIAIHGEKIPLNLMPAMTASGTVEPAEITRRLSLLSDFDALIDRRPE